MRRRPARTTTTLAACASLALAQMFATAARADSSVVSNTTLGSALNLGLIEGWGLPLNPELDPPKRSPSGFLYSRSFLVPEAQVRTSDGWIYSGDIEAGGSGSWGDTTNYFFQRYKDVGNGVYVRSFGLTAEKPDTASFLEAYGGEVGRTDQYYSLAFGRYNAWKVNAFFNETPTVYSSTYRSLWNGIGSDNVTLNGLTPGGSGSLPATQANLRAAIAATGDTSVGIKRKTGGIRFDMNLGEAWKIYASYTNQNRQGARLFGTVFGGGEGGGNIDTTESVDYNTHELLAGAQYGDKLTSFNLQLSASLFRNGIDTMTVANPLTVLNQGVAGIPASTFTSARYDLYPDNDYYKIKADWARALPSLWNGRLTASVAWARSSQNDNLIAPTALALTGGTINGIPAANAWNTTASLQQGSADAQIDSTLANVRLILNPLPVLSLTGNVRYYETDNSTSYTACNPLTSQWGRLLNDGSGTSIVNTSAYLAARCNLGAVRALGVAPSAGDIPIGSVPFDYRQLVYSLTGDYRLTPKSSLNASFEQENYHRSNRERDKTWENKLKAGYTSRELEDAVVLVSYEYDSRRGSAYGSDPYRNWYSESLGPVPTTTGTNMATWIHTAESLRKYDVADRDQNIVKARVEWTAVPSLDAALSAQYNGIRYPDSSLGRNGTSDQGTVSLSLNWDPDARWGIYGSYTWQSAKTSQTGLEPNACIMGLTYYFFSNGAVSVIDTPPAGATLVGTTQVTPANWQQVCATPSALSPLYPTSRTWTTTQNSTNQSIVVGGRYDFGAARFNASYTYVNGRTRTSYGYNASALGYSPDQIALAGGGMPDAVFIQSILDASVLVPLTRALALRLYYRYENGRVSDWHFDGVQGNPVPAANAAYLDYGLQPYHASLAGLFLRYSF